MITNKYFQKHSHILEAPSKNLPNKILKYFRVYDIIVFWNIYYYYYSFALDNYCFMHGDFSFGYLIDHCSIIVEVITIFILIFFTIVDVHDSTKTKERILRVTVKETEFFLY